MFRYFCVVKITVNIGSTHSVDESGCILTVSGSNRCFVSYELKYLSTMGDRRNFFHLWSRASSVAPQLQVLWSHKHGAALRTAQRSVQRLASIHPFGENYQQRRRAIIHLIHSISKGAYIDTGGAVTSLAAAAAAATPGMIEGSRSVSRSSRRAAADWCTGLVPASGIEDTDRASLLALLEEPTSLTGRFLANRKDDSVIRELRTDLAAPAGHSK